MKQSLTPAKLISLITKEVFKRFEANFDHEIIEGNHNIPSNKKYSVATSINCYVIETLVNYNGFEDELTKIIDLPRSGFMTNVKKTKKLISEDIVKKIIITNIINNIINEASVSLKYSPFLKPQTSLT